MTSYGRGEVSADFLYGFTYLREKFNDCELLEFEATNSGSYCFRILNRMDRMLSYLLLFNLKLSVAIRVVQRLQRFKIVYTNIDSIGLSLGLLKLFFPLRFHLVHISQGLSNSLDQKADSLKFTKILQKELTGSILSSLDGLMVLGTGAKASFVKNGLVRANRVLCNQFGVDTDFWTPADEGNSTKGNYILSVGSDAGRDYDTLLASVRETPLLIVTRMEIEPRSNVMIKSEIDDFELRELYRGARFVIIPLHNISQPSGQSATLQAMACGKAVIISDTIGFWDRVSFENNKHLVFIPPYEKDILAGKVEDLLNSSMLCDELGVAARELVVEKFGSHDFGSKLACVGEACLSEQLSLCV